MQRATTSTPAIQPYGGLPTAALQDLLRPDTADAATHRLRTPDSGHLDAQTSAPDTGHRSRGQASVDTDWSLAPDTGHRTPDTGHRTPEAG